MVSAAADGAVPVAPRRPEAPFGPGVVCRVLTFASSALIAASATPAASPGAIVPSSEPRPNAVKFFWRVADTGDRILDNLTGSDQPPQTKRGYLKLVGEIYEKLREIPGLSGTQKAVWVTLADELQSREAQTAWLYFDRLSDMRVLTASDADLPSIQGRVRQIRDELLTQKAEFDQLARRAGELAQPVR